MSEPVTATFLFTDHVGSTAWRRGLVPRPPRPSASSTSRTRGASVGDRWHRGQEHGRRCDADVHGPESGLSCAAAIQQGIDRHNRRGEEPLDLRIGVSMGEAVEDAGDYYGDCVVEAARLCDKARLRGTDPDHRPGGGRWWGRHSYARSSCRWALLGAEGHPIRCLAVEVRWEPSWPKARPKGQSRCPRGRWARPPRASSASSAGPTSWTTALDAA